LIKRYKQKQQFHETVISQKGFLRLLRLYAGWKLLCGSVKK